MALDTQSRHRDPRWWHEDNVDETHEAVTANLDELATAQTDRSSLLNTYYALYTDSHDEDLAIEDLQRDRKSRFNIIASSVNTVVAKVTRNRPAPRVVTIGGDWDLYNKAKSFTKYIEGEFDRLGAYEKLSSAVLDAAIFGTGCLKVCADEDTDLPAVEVAWVGDMFVDDRESRHGSVRTLYHVRAVDRFVLTEMFPDHAEEIEKSDPYEHPDEIADVASSDLVLVIEAWHLKSGDNSKDGKHVICTSEVTLLEEGYDKQDFPFVFIRWQPDPRGFFGRGLAESMSGVQSELNWLSAQISQSFRLTVPSVWIEDSSDVNVYQIDNAPVRIYRYSGTPPQFMSPAATSEQHLQRERELIDRGMNLSAGVSMLSSTSMKPEGLNSGKALRVYYDIESERLSPHYRRYENAAVELAKRLVEIAEDLVRAGRSSKLKVLVGDDDMLESIKYSDVRMEREVYRIRVYPASALSQSISGKIQDIEDLVNLQAIDDKQEVRRLLDMPDLERLNTLESAARDIVDKLLDKAMRGEDVVGNPYMDLQYALRRATQMIDIAKIRNAPENVFTALTNFAGHVMSLIQQQAPPPMMAPQPGAPPEGGPPPAPPMQ